MRKKLSKIITAICVFIGVVLYALFGYKGNTAVEPIPTINEPVQTEISIPMEQQQTTVTNVSDAFYNLQGLEKPARIQGRSERILNRKNYTASFNTKWNIPNWVAWDITKEELVEKYERTDYFDVDPEINPDRAVTYGDYSGSGYDRGHMCPAGDNRYDATAMEECFYMTNICPQDHELNKETWNDLEIACRRWARRYGKVYVVCGPIVYDADNAEVIGRRHKVVVPDAFFKVILIVNKQTPQAIGYIFQNNSSRKPWKAYSVDEVEEITGIDFFPTLPDEIENPLEANYNTNLWGWDN